MVCGRSGLRQGLDSPLDRDNEECKADQLRVINHLRSRMHTYTHERSSCTYTHTYINIQRKRKAVGPSIMLLSSCVICGSVLQEGGS